MAETILATANERKVWRKNYFRDYVRASRYAPYMGASPSSIFVTARDTTSGAKTVSFPWVGRLRSDGVYNDGILEGNEEAIPNQGFDISTQYIRNATVVPKSTSYKTEIDLMGAARPLLKDWSATNLQRWIIANGLGAATKADGTNAPLIPILDKFGNVVKAAALAADLNSWITTNSDRTLFGITTANNTGTFSTSAQNVDSANDKFSTDAGSLMKQLAKETEGSATAITPHRIEDGREYFVAMCGSRTFRDLKKDPVLLNANREARPRDVEANPIFQDGDQIYDGIIYREDPMITALLTKGSPFLSAAGASSIPVEPVFLCGTAAVGIGWNETPNFETQRTDYGFRPGVAIQENRGVEKFNYNGKQLGIVTGFFSGAA